MSEMAGKLFSWVNNRLPFVNTFERHLSKHPVPSKVNFWYLFGALAAVALIIQIVTGIWLIMPYSNTEEQAFSSIEYIMRDVDYGWVIRYMHTTGASLFLQLFIFICLEAYFMVHIKNLKSWFGSLVVQFILQ